MPIGRALAHDDAAAALRQSRGLVAVAARLLGVDRTSLHRCIARSPRLQAVIAEQREVVLDMAEGKLIERVMAGDLQAIMFTLRTLGKERGYIERTEQEHTGEGGGPMVFTLDLRGGQRFEPLQPPLRMLPEVVGDD